MLTESEHTRIAHAITEAKSKSAGEIFCVLTHEVSRYREVPLAWAAVAAFVVPLLLTFVGLSRL
jgi:putative membrane protein